MNYTVSARHRCTHGFSIKIYSRYEVEKIRVRYENRYKICGRKDVTRQSFIPKILNYIKE